MNYNKKKNKKTFVKYLKPYSFDLEKENTY